MAYDASGNQVANFAVQNFFSQMPVTRHTDGRIFLFSNPLTPQIRGYTTAGPTSPIFVPQFAVTAMCVVPSGRIFYVSGTLIGPASYTRMTASGASFGTLNFAAVTLPLDIIPDPSGRVWVAESLPVSPPLLERINADETTTTIVPVAVNGTLRDFDIDHQGAVWLLTDGPRQLTRVNGDGNTLASILLPNSVAFDIDGCGRPKVLESTAGAWSVRTLNPQLTATLSTFAVPATATWLFLHADGAGRSWITGTDAGGRGVILLVNAQGGVISTILAPVMQSYMSAGVYGHNALHIASALARQSDGDGDGHSSRIEWMVGRDPLSGTSVPAQLSLTGSTAPGGSFAVSLSAPADVGFTYITAAALGTDGISTSTLDPCPMAPLSPDFLLFFWLSPDNTFAPNGIVGLVAGDGTATTTINIPALPGLSGLSFFLSTLTYDPFAARFATVTAPRQIVVM